MPLVEVGVTVVQLLPRLLPCCFLTVADAIPLPQAVLRLLEASILKKALFSGSIVVCPLRAGVIRLLHLESPHIASLRSRGSTDRMGIGVIHMCTF